MKKHNFSAGPAILPASVMEQAAKAAIDLDESGLSVMEISHRSAAFKGILAEATSSVKELLNISDDYAVLFLTGGASSQFFMTAMNLLNPDDTVAYLETGSWSAKAIKEAKLFGKVEVVASSKEDGYKFIPKNYSIPADTKFVHFTSNNTIVGTQYQELPKTDLPLICDMSSDIFCRPVDVNRFGVIYAGAQKNLGPAGTTLVIVRKDLLGKVERDIPTMLDYNTHIKKDSAFNTPPVFPIYVCMLTLRWIKEMGGLEAMQKHNEEKAAIFYNALDENPLFEGVAAKEDRSLMNGTFVLKDESLADGFLAACEKANISGIKGHRSVGGFRASMYNAMPKASIELLVEVMHAFAKQTA